MDTYSHITPFERGCIMALHEPGYSPAAIATILNRHRCTISRELNRNRSPDGTYSAQEAQEQYGNRRLVCHRKRKLDDPEIFALVKDRFLKQHWSPEQKYRPRKCLQWRTPCQVYFEQPLHLV